MRLTGWHNRLSAVQRDIATRGHDPSVGEKYASGYEQKRQVPVSHATQSSELFSSQPFTLTS